PLTRGREITSFGARVVIGCPTRTIFLTLRGKPWHILPAVVGGGDERLSPDFASVCGAHPRAQGRFTSPYKFVNDHLSDACRGHTLNRPPPKGAFLCIVLPSPRAPWAAL